MRMLLAILLSLPLLAGGGGTVTFKQTSFLSEVAATEPEKAKGLMYRQSLAKDRCMFFVYPADGDHAIWMKNCLIALDVAWVDAEGRVVETVEHIPPAAPCAATTAPATAGPCRPDTSSSSLRGPSSAWA